MSEAIMVLSDLGEHGAPMQIMENRSNVNLSSFLTLKDFEACLLT